MFGDLYKNEKGWVKRKLGEVCILNPKKSELNIDNSCEVSFVPMVAVSEKGDIDSSDIRTYEEVKTGFTYFVENDVLFAKITPCMENGKGAIAKSLKNGIGFGSTEFHVLRPKVNIIDSQWLYTLTILDMFRHDAERKMTGSAGQKRVPIKFFDDFEVGIPPRELQNQFADFVNQVDKLKFEIQETYFESLDDVSKLQSML